MDFFKSLKLNLARRIGWFRLLFKIAKIRMRRLDSPYIILLNIPSHGNMGDHLICKAEIQFFQDHFKNEKFLYFTTADLYYSAWLVSTCIKKQDIVYITGGGFLGSIWPQEEYRIQSLLRLLPNNKIIFFPETIYYSEDTDSKRLLERAISIYGKHNNLYLSTRDINSYNLAQNQLLSKYKERVFFLPDIALYLKIKLNLRREGVLFCLRNDREINNTNREIIQEIQCILNGEKLFYTDTVIHKTISLANQEKEISLKATEFASAKLVVTDRLHGMIYATITGTPVIALDNLSGKVKLVYDAWLSNIDFVYFISDKKDISAAINKLINIGDCEFDNSMFKNKFEILKFLATDLL